MLTDILITRLRKTISQACPNSIWKGEKAVNHPFTLSLPKIEQVDRSCCLLRKRAGSKDPEVCWVMWMSSNYRLSQEDYSSSAYDSMQPHLFPALGDDNEFGTADPKLPGFKGHSAYPTYPFMWRDPLRECLSLDSNKSEWKGKERLCQLILEIFGKRMMNLGTVEVWPKSQTGRCSGAVFPWHLCILASPEETATVSCLFWTSQRHLWGTYASSSAPVVTNFVPFFPYPLWFLCFLPPKGRWNT